MAPSSPHPSTLRVADLALKGAGISRALVALALMLPLLGGGCGFKPVYGTNSASHAPTVVAQFAAIEIPPLPERRGQELRNMLIDKLHAGGAAAEYKYRLGVSLREADINLGLQQNSTSTRGQIRLTAEYWLYDSTTGATLLHETLRSSTGYNILVNQFGSVLSNEDSREQGLQQIADDMTQHLALYMNQEH